MKSLNPVQAKDMLLAVADSIIENVDLLTSVDSKIGDGDHGIGMSGGMKKAKEALLKAAEPETVNESFRLMGKTMLLSMGGASGVIFGSMFESGAKKTASASKLDRESLAAMMRQSLLAIKQRGNAQLGDKTMVDAFEPAVLAIENSKSDELETVLGEAEAAAYEGMENTKKYAAKFGRAKSLMERSIGYQDAGATSVWLIFKAMRSFVDNIR